MRRWLGRREMRADLALWSVAFFHGNLLYRVALAMPVCMEVGEGFPLLFVTPGGRFFEVTEEGRWRWWRLSGRALSRHEAVAFLVRWYGPVDCVLLLELASL